MQPIMMACIIKFLRVYRPRSLLSGDTWWLCAFISFLPVLFLVADNLSKPNSEQALTGRQRALYPEINPKLLHKKPTGIVFGLAGKNYVCKQFEMQGHTTVIGGSGSGKSSCLCIPTVLSNPEARIFAIDIKGELSFKSTKYGDAHVMIVNPADRNSYGYNPFYALDENSSTQDILETMQNISFSLISLSASETQPFWKQSGRNLLTGLLIYYYKQGMHDFISVIDAILSKPVKDSIQEVLNNAKSDSVEYRYIVQFSDIADGRLGGLCQ